MLAANSGYGFIAKISDLQTKNKSGKAALNTKGAIPLGPEKFTSLENSYIASITEEGKMLLIDSKDLPILSKGKGIKLSILIKRNLNRKKINWSLLKPFKKDLILKYTVASKAILSKLKI